MKKETVKKEKLVWGIELEDFHSCLGCPLLEEREVDSKGNPTKDKYGCLFNRKLLDNNEYWSANAFREWDCCPFDCAVSFDSVKKSLLTVNKSLEKIKERCDNISNDMGSIIEVLDCGHNNMGILA